MRYKVSFYTELIVESEEPIQYGEIPKALAKHMIGNPEWDDRWIPFTICFIEMFLEGAGVTEIKPKT